MNDQPNEKPQPLVIDLDQWRRDINTFASTTKQALNGIVSELSNQCADGIQGVSQDRSFVSEKRTTQLSSSKNRTATRQTKIAGDHSKAEESKSKATERGSLSRNRLSDLKDRLAQRIAKNG